jgi:hypothetical protein
MTQEALSVESHAAALSEVAGTIVHELPEVPGIQDHPLLSATANVGLTSAVGTVAFAGQYASGDYAVQFNRQDGHGFSSSWPAWAYEIAKSALEHNKRLWVASNGDPFGSNLVFVFLYAY